MSISKVDVDTCIVTKWDESVDLLVLNNAYAFLLRSEAKIASGSLKSLAVVMSLT